MVDDEDENWDCYGDDDRDDEDSDDDAYCVAPGHAGGHGLCWSYMCRGMGVCMYPGSGR